MNDKELLELAAKAAGIELWQDVAGNYYENPKQSMLWNPLTDDGDALRLAVKLSISFSDDYMYPNGEHYIKVGCVYGNTLYGDSEPCGNDMYAATRRAIVRAAAEIGKSMMTRDEFVAMFPDQMWVSYE